MKKSDIISVILKEWNQHKVWIIIVGVLILLFGYYARWKATEPPQYADLYLCGHSHDLFSSKRIYITYYGQKEKAFLNTGSFLKTAEIGTCNYSERAGYPPQKLGIARIEWMPFKDKRVETGKQRGDLHIID